MTIVPFAGPVATDLAGGCRDSLTGWLPPPTPPNGGMDSAAAAAAATAAPEEMESAMEIGKGATKTRDGAVIIPDTTG